MSQGGEGPDTSSIKPISSLRTKFESLSRDQDAALSPLTPRQSSLSPTLSAFGSRPRTSGGESDAAGMGLAIAAQPSAPLSSFGSMPRRIAPNFPNSPRPVSMISMSSPPNSPPMVTVDSPRSPPKTVSNDLRSRTSSRDTPLQPLTPNITSDATDRFHSRTISRAATPALEARAAAFLHSAALPMAKDVPVSATTETRPIPETSKVPPLVNRAAKPRVPAKPTTLAKKPSNLAAPEANADITDHSISPFSTPPSSGGNSPDPRKDPTRYTQQEAPDSFFKQRSRVDSDASWVQRIRGDSDASTLDRNRTGSNASFVEPSFLPESWTQPPIHHAVAAQREQQSNGSGSTQALPMRYRAMPGRGSSTTDDLPDDRPRLPARPELQIRSGRVSPPKARSGRTSPLKHSILPPRKSIQGLRRAATVGEESDNQPRIPASNPGPRSALSQGFDRALPSMVPAVPAARRSIDRRREMPPPPPPPPPPSATLSRNGYSRDDEEDPAPYGLNSEQVAGPTDFPDATRTNRRAPRFQQRPWQIPTEYDTRLFAVCGEYVCTSGYITKAWNLRTGELLLYLEHRENVKATSIVFKPSSDMEDEGKRIWVGTNTGDIIEIDIPSQTSLKTRNAHGRREVTRMFRYASELWTLDDGGEMYVWKPDHKGMPSLDSQYRTWRIPKRVAFSIAAGRQLWVATGKEIRVFKPGAQTDSEFQVLRSPLSQTGTGDVTCGATLDSYPDLIYFGHSDGKVSVYSRNDFSCKGIVNVSVYKISTLAGVGDYLWAGYSTGMAYVYDTSTNPWTVKKDWKAHEKQICSIIADPSALWKMGRLNVVTLGLDNSMRVWDGMLENDWLETRMHSRDLEYCSFYEITAAVLTWNAGASKPHYLQHSIDDSSFFIDYLKFREPPDILVFGFQELVDLEDKKMTAKSFFKSRKKDPAEQEHMSHQYRAWRDHLTQSVNDHMPSSDTYIHLHTTSMVGLFTCIFVKSRLRPRIKHVHTAEVKRGMGGHHGNKGALIVRMVLDDSSICFVNCHLAAGQTQTMHRNNDIAEILEANALPAYPLGNAEVASHSDVFAAGGDGSMIMDHEICIINGDLNYRIDTMGRDAVIKHVQQGNLAKLLERDQLLLSRKKNPGFRLRAFQESPITFAPTYKYNMHSDDYDSSEKRRAPAWCDRILYRGIGKVMMEDYRRWDQIRVSDHRPVSGRLKLRVKTLDADKRGTIWDRCLREFESVSRRIAHAAELEYLTNVLGMPAKEAAAALQRRS